MSDVDAVDADRVEEPELETLSIAISPPIVVKDKTFASLELREPRVSEIKASEELLGGVVTPAAMLDAEMRLVMLVAAWNEEAIGQLPASVLNRAADFLTGFEIRGRGFKDAGPSLCIEFDPPVSVSKGPFSEMILREPRVLERRRAEAHLSKGMTAFTVRAAEITLVTDVSEWHPAAVLKMPISQFARASVYLSGFLELGRRTGASSPPT